MHYKNKLTGEEVSITEENEQFYFLSNGTNILKNMFISNYVPADMPDITKREELDMQVNENLNKLKNSSTSESNKLDPNEFFNNPGKYNSLVDKLNNLNHDGSNENLNTETVIKQGNEVFKEQSLEDRIEEARQRNAHLIEKYGNKNANAPQKTKEQLEEEQRKADLELLNGGGNVENKPKESKDPYLKNKQNSTQTQQPNVQFNSNDVLSTFMKSFKNNHKVNLKFSISEKIVEPDFIKMISNNLEGDIIEYYTKLFLDKLMYDPDLLKEIIYKQLYKEVYGVEYVKKEEVEEVESFKVSGENEDETEDGLIEGKPTKSGTKTYYFFNEKGEVKSYILKTAKSKGYKPAKKEDIK